MVILHFFPLESSTFSSGLILLLNVWSGKRTGLPPQLNSAIAEVHKCMAYIRVCEERCVSAPCRSPLEGLITHSIDGNPRVNSGTSDHIERQTLIPSSLLSFHRDLLYELATIGQLPLPQTSTPADPGPASGTSTSMSTQNSHKRAQQDDDATEYAHTGAARTNTNTHFAPSAVFQTPIQSQFAGLPTYTADLGRLPVYTQYAPNAASVSTSDSSSNSSWYPQQPSFAGSVGVDSGALGPAPMEPSAFAPAPGGETWFPFNDPHADMDFDPAQASRELGEMMNLIDSDTIAMWTNAPVGFECVVSFSFF
jgi:hypothetical protein